MAEGSGRGIPVERGARLRIAAVGFAVAVLAVGVVAGMVAGLPRDSVGALAQALPDQAGALSLSGGVPAATAGFVAAYGHSDYSTIERVASPLFFVEWAREGVSVVDQASLLQQHQHSATGEWLHFTYATGLVDNRGFGHYLYVGRPISSSGSPSVWRVDAEASGRVIWIEMVWLFSARTLATRALPPNGAQDDRALRALIPSGPGDVVFGVGAADGPEGYYGVGPKPGSAGVPANADSVQFYAVDDSGLFRLPVWSYGERFPNHPLAGRQQLQPEQARVLRDYLASIH